MTLDMKDVYHKLKLPCDWCGRILEKQDFKTWCARCAQPRILCTRHYAPGPNGRNYCFSCIRKELPYSRVDWLMLSQLVQGPQDPVAIANAAGCTVEEVRNSLRQLWEDGLLLKQGVFSTSYLVRPEAKVVLEALTPLFTLDGKAE